MTAMRVTLIGTGDAFSTQGRNQAATLIECEHGAMLIDCGATTQTALQSRSFDTNSLRLVAITHLHGDHFGGLPYLLLGAQWGTRRTAPLTIAGPPGTRARLDNLIDVLYPDATTRTPWSFDWRVVEMEPGETRLLEGFTIRTAAVEHPSGGPATAVRVEALGRTVVHSGDTRWTDVLPVISRKADLFIVECYSYTGPMPMHLDYETLLQHQKLFECDCIVLTHMGPSMLKHRDKVDRKLFKLASDGRVFEL